MSDVLSESTVDCCTLQDVGCSDHCTITVTEQLDINVVFRRFAYRFMSIVTTFPDCIVTDIVNCEAYQQSPLMNKWESMLYEQ